MRDLKSRVLMAEIIHLHARLHVHLDSRNGLGRPSTIDLEICQITDDSRLLSGP